MSCKVYVGDLKDATEKDLSKEFAHFGHLKSVWVARNPAGFAFVEFEDPRDAEDAVREMDGRRIGSSRVRVELATGRSKSKPWQRGERGERSRPPPPRGRRPFHPEDKCYECGKRGHYAYDCPQYAGRRGGARRSSRHSRSRSRSPRRSSSRSRSRSPKRSRRTTSRSRSHSRSQSRSPVARRRSGSETGNAADRLSEDR